MSTTQVKNRPVGVNSDLDDKIRGVRQITLPEKTLKRIIPKTDFDEGLKKMLLEGIEIADDKTKTSLFQYFRMVSGELRARAKREGNINNMKELQAEAAKKFFGTVAAGVKASGHMTEESIGKAAQDVMECYDQVAIEQLMRDGKPVTAEEIKKVRADVILSDEKTEYVHSVVVDAAKERVSAELLANNSIVMMKYWERRLLRFQKFREDIKKSAAKVKEEMKKKKEPKTKITAAIGKAAKVGEDLGLSERDSEDLVLAMIDSIEMKALMSQYGNKNDAIPKSLILATLAMKAMKFGMKPDDGSGQSDDEKPRALKFPRSETKVEEEHKLAA